MRLHMPATYPQINSLASLVLQSDQLKLCHEGCVETLLEQLGKRFVYATLIRKPQRHQLAKSSFEMLL